MKYKIFKGTLIGWKELFQQAADFASELGPRRVQTISHSGSNGRGIVTVWYVDEEETAESAEASIPLKVKCDFSRGTLISWEDLFEETCTKASKLLPELFVSISHSDDKGNGVVALWYWSS
ncbi:MAG: hypothetical protein ACYTG5_10650 [Planctomycetota bacterium]|jgi:hypothetical protein